MLRESGEAGADRTGRFVCGMSSCIVGVKFKSVSSGTVATVAAVSEGIFVLENFDLKAMGTVISRSRVIRIILPLINPKLLLLGFL